MCTQRFCNVSGDRAERLAISAALLDLDGLDSTKDLTMGQAGQLYRTLVDIRDRGELHAAAHLADEDQADEDQADEDQADRLTLAQMIMRAVVLMNLPARIREKAP